MTISVLIPTYNSASVIRGTLDSVLGQTVSPDEILVLDDGSTDETVSTLESYRPRITVLQQENRGVASARNALCARARGDLIAFLDHDDLWHPRYLEMQRELFQTYPRAKAFFTGHVDFTGYNTYEWTTDPGDDKGKVELIDPLTFFRRYNTTTGYFSSMSFCCVPKQALQEMGNEPFQISGVDDSYLCTVLPLLGPVVYTPARLVAYRLTVKAQSTDRLRTFGLWVNVFELLESRYQKQAYPELHGAFQSAFAAKRRAYGRILMGVGKSVEARRQFRESMVNSSDLASRAKSLRLWLLSFLPSALQPAWPSSVRESGPGGSIPSAKELVVER